MGKEIQQRDIQRQVEADHIGEVVAIDVDSGGLRHPNLEATRYLRLERNKPRDVS